MPLPAPEFHKRILAWFDQYGRKDLPWQQDITSYRVWLAETMLQQTQVTTAIPYFKAFTVRFPTLESLADASVDEVLRLWSGLGYYARARNLHKAAQAIARQGFFPDTLEGLTALPGIGRSTAGAILSIAFHNSQPILDGNVKRVLCRYQAIHGWPGQSQVSKRLWAISAELTPTVRVADYTQAMMDLGATLCTRSQPDCPRCPINDVCQARLTGTVSSLPHPKPKKTMPVKRLVMLLAKGAGANILLEQRPSMGLWGGLWSLPEFDDEAQALAWCRARFAVSTWHTGEARQHDFSHYRLEYTPLWVKAENPNDFVMEASRMVWYNARQVNGLGLPAPVKKLLQEHFNEGEHDQMGAVREIGQGSGRFGDPAVPRRKRPGNL